MEFTKTKRKEECVSVFFHCGCGLAERDLFMMWRT